MTVTIHHGDSRDVLKTLADASVDSIVCDPPYALVSITKRFGAENAAPAKAGKTGAYQRASAGFMGKQWDTGETAFAVEFWSEVMRVLKPGGHVVAFSGTRTYHRLACAVEDAGFEIRDMLSWLYGSGFPKSHDVSKGIDRGERGRLVRAKLLHFSEVRGITGAWLEERGVASAASFRDWTVGGHVPSDANWKIVASALEVSPAEEALFEREVVARAGNGIAGGTGDHAGQANAYGFKESYELTTSATDAARQWEGWGTALKPACEPIVFARKPLASTVAGNVLLHGTGALNIDGCRVGDGAGVVTFERHAGDRDRDQYRTGTVGASSPSQQGRWPANVLHDGSDEVVAGFPDTASGGYPPEGGQRSQGSTYGKPNERGERMFTSSEGSAARFFKSASSTDDELVFWQAKAILAAWNPELANTADDSFVLSNEAAVSALSDAVTSAFPATLSPSPEHSMAGTPSELRRLLTTAIMAILNIAEGSSPALPLERLTQTGCRVSIAETCVLTGTTTITISHWKSDGSAAPATFSITPRSRDRGDQALASGKRLHYTAKADATDRLGSKHPTVKPTDLMRWLVRLVTPPGGVVLDPFAGSGSTGVACIAEGFDAILIEREAEYVADIRRRIAWAQGEGRLTAQEMQRNPQVDDAGAGLPLFGGAAA